ncbi:UPF0183-domain-containing protein [Thelephora terrestris]|uniref:UPF0183-domain-containing protein n=1 Tax=Thelephora terrestris TaxID=56493 RepID=A0A9P6H5V7_9AGAM|nr:UPF0183-domain-containing protein [Thelephora terrestris]
MYHPALDVDIRPGSGLGIFELGSSLWTIIELLTGLQNEFPQVETKFDIASPTSPIIIHLRPHLDLLFSEHHQRLHTITLKRFRDAPPVTIRFKDRILFAPNQTLQRVDVNRAVGPTYEGEELRYPGVWFSFDEHAAPQAQNQEIKSITVTQHNGQERDGLQEVLECPVMCGDIARAVAKVHKGVLLHFYPTATSEPCFVEIGVTTAQDLSVELGSPLRTHYREDDRMHIHSRLRTNDEEEDDSSCMGPPSPRAFYLLCSPKDFYNYFHYGIDFLISGTTHTVRKIILHTNVPGTPLFHRYKRCPWEIEGVPEDDEDDSPPSVKFTETADRIRRFLNPRETPHHMPLNRTDDEEGLNLPNPITRLWGFDGVILEAAEPGQQVVSLTLF